MSVQKSVLAAQSSFFPVFIKSNTDIPLSCRRRTKYSINCICALLALSLLNRPPSIRIPGSVNAYSPLPISVIKSDGKRDMFSLIFVRRLVIFTSYIAARTTSFTTSFPWCKNILSCIILSMAKNKVTSPSIFIILFQK